MDSLDLVRLPPLMALTSGDPGVVVGLLDGEVAFDHPDLAAGSVRRLGKSREANDAARRHGTFIAGILSARRGSPAPAIAPDCTLLVRSIFHEAGVGGEPSTDAAELADAIVEC